MGYNLGDFSQEHLVTLVGTKATVARQQGDQMRI
jgi:hypothetical protein